MTGPCAAASCCAMNGVGSRSRRAARAARRPAPSRASSLQLVTLNTSAAMPSPASCCAALITSVRIAPEPSSVTALRRLPRVAVARRSGSSRAARPSSALGRQVGLRVVLVHQRDVIEDVLLLDQHLAHAVVDDHRHLAGEGRVVGLAVREWSRPPGGCCRPGAAGPRRRAWCGPRWRRAGSRARAGRRRPRSRRPRAGSRTSSSRCRTAASPGRARCSWWPRPSSWRWRRPR